MTSRRMSALTAALGLLAVAGPAAAILPPSPPPAIPSPPTAAFTISPPSAATGALVTFDANASTNDPRTPLTFRWDFDGDGTVDQETPEFIVRHRYPSAGGRDVVLQVVAAAYGETVAQTATARRHIQVVDHPAPMAHIVNPPAVVAPLQQITLHGAATYLSDTDVVYAWEFNGDLKPSSPTPDTTLTFLSPATYTVRLHVTDSLGSEGVATTVIRVNAPPVARFAVRGEAVAGRSVVLDAAGSSDDLGITRYAWDLDGDGTFETDGGASPARPVAFPAPGAHTVGLRVTDADGADAVSTDTVTVTPAPDPGPPPPQPSVRAVRGRVAIPVTCPPGPSCTVTVRLRGTGPLAGTPLGTATVRPPGGGTGTATVALSAAAMREVGRAHTLRATLVTRTSAAGRAPAITRGPLRITG